MEQTILTDEPMHYLLSVCQVKSVLASDKLFLGSYTSIQKCEGTSRGAEPDNYNQFSLSKILVYYSKLTMKQQKIESNYSHGGSPNSLLKHFCFCGYGSDDSSS